MTQQLAAFDTPFRTQSLFNASGITNTKEIRVAGIPRSGQHAIIQWILSQAKTKRYVFLNACQASCFLNPYNNDDENSVHSAGRWDKKDILLYNFEMKRLADVFSHEFEEFHDGVVGRSADRYDLLILRDPFNNFASLYRWGNGNGWATRDWMIDCRELWKTYAWEFLGRTANMKHTPTRVNFNKWFQDWGYRKTIISGLGYDFDEFGIINVVARVGITKYLDHTFDGLTFDGRAQEMKLLERWKHYRDDELFRSVFDHETRSLSETIFGPICDL